MDRHILFVQYSENELHPISDKNHGWCLTSGEVCLALNIDLGYLFELKEEHAQSFIEDKHFLYSQIQSCGYSNGAEVLLWTKKGIFRLAYLLKNTRAMDFIDFMEDFHFQCQEKVDDEIGWMFNSIEEMLKDRINKVKTSPTFNPSELQDILAILDQLVVKKKKAYGMEEKNDTSPLGTIGKIFNLDQENISSMITGFLKDSFSQSNQRFEEMKRSKTAEVKANKPPMKGG